MTQSTVFGVVPAGAGQQVLDDLNLSDQALATEHEGDEAPAETYPWMRWRDDTDTLLDRPSSTSAGDPENYGATADPTVDDDETVGYVRASCGSGTDDRVFWCTNPATVARRGSRPGPAALARPRCSAAPARWWRRPATIPPTRSTTATTR